MDGALHTCFFDLRNLCIAHALDFRQLSLAGECKRFDGVDSCKESNKICVEYVQLILKCACVFVLTGAFNLSKISDRELWW